MRKKILIITPFNPKYVGGAETFCKDLLHEARKKHTVDVATLEDHYKSWDNPSAFFCIVIAIRLLYRALLDLHVWQGKRYETVHCLGIIGTAVGVVLKKIYGVKLISTTLAIYNFKDWPGWKRAIIRCIFKNVDKVFVEDAFGEFDLFSIGIKMDKIEIFTHWVNIKMFSPLEKVYPPPLEKDLDVLFVARPIEKKGIDIIKGVEWRLKREKINFKYISDISYDALAVFYACADIVVVPSLYDEGVSRVVVEAAASGCLVIASNKGSLPDLVGPFGEVVEPTVDNFEDKIMFYHMRREVLKEKKKAARLYAEEHFSNKNAEVFCNGY